MSELNQRINITVHYGHEQAADLRIPINVSVNQLIQAVTEALDIQADYTDSFQIRVTDKQLLLSDNQRVSDYPITNGDIIELI